VTEAMKAILLEIHYSCRRSTRIRIRTQVCASTRSLWELPEVTTVANAVRHSSLLLLTHRIRRNAAQTKLACMECISTIEVTLMVWFVLTSKLFRLRRVT
jgi:hypothetical protein